jgi:pimeloyl-ACP methyl ester carboxylesterase
MIASETEGLTRHAVHLSTGVTLNVVERPGIGTPVICQHGIWDNWKYWMELVPDGPGSFSGRPLLMVDLRGHGDSDKPETGYGWDEYTADIVALVNELGYDQVTLAGHSLGSIISLLVAAEMPERVESLLLEDPPLPMRPTSADVFRTLLDLKQRSFETVVDEFMAWRPWITRDDAEASARRLVNTADGVLREAAEGRLAGGSIPNPTVRIDAPVLVIQAGIEDQRAFGKDGPELLSATMPNLTIETVPGTSHNVLREQPLAYRQILAEFFDG